VGLPEETEIEDEAQALEPVLEDQVKEVLVRRDPLGKIQKKGKVLRRRESQGLNLDQLAQVSRKKADLIKLSPDRKELTPKKVASVNIKNPRVIKFLVRRVPGRRIHEQDLEQRVLLRKAQ
jgi:hypothetical protein